VRYDHRRESFPRPSFSVPIKLRTNLSIFIRSQKRKLVACLATEANLFLASKRFVILILTRWRDSSQDFYKASLNPGEGASPDSFFPSFRPAIAELTRRGKKGCFMKTKTSSIRNSMNGSALRLTFLLVPLLLGCLALAPQARAVCQKGCSDSGNNTFLGEDALVINTGGFFNTAIGFNALKFNTNGSTTRPAVLERFLATPTATATRPPVLMRSS